MKLSAVYKDRWRNIDDKELFTVATNGGNYNRCNYSLVKAGDEYLIGVINHGG